MNVDIDIMIINYGYKCMIFFVWNYAFGFFYVC